MANFTITRLNHLVLWVRDAQRSLAFYRDVLGFEVAAMPSPRAVFLRASGSDNHHDLGLFSIGPDAPAPSQGQQVGMYHAAWEVADLTDLTRAREALQRSGHLVGESDHGNSLSLYAKDPDGNELEVFWMVPRDEWETRGFATRRLDLEGEIARRTAGVQVGPGSTPVRPLS
jgi:catechol-2,3-dioxygenase